MKSFFFFNDLSESGPVWLNVIWSYVNVAKETVNATPLYFPIDDPTGRSRVGRRLKYLRDKWTHGKRLRQEVLDQLDPNGPNILFVKALSKKDINWSIVLHPIWSAFSHHVLLIGDPLEPTQLGKDVVTRFDLITCYCGDLAEEYEKTLGIRSLYVPAHTDVLRFHSMSEYRPIDLILVGRRNREMHAPLYRHFNAAGRERLFLDFVTRTKMQQSFEEEFRLLMTTYSKSKATFCYEPSYAPRFKDRSPLTGRWAHAWAAGCTVFGSKPRGLGVASATDWPESIIELSPDPTESIQIVKDALSDEAGIARRRTRNVLEAVRRHDSRYRLRDILNELGLPLPDGLKDGLAQLEALGNKLERDTSFST